jgi:hypothetical protein
MASHFFRHSSATYEVRFTWADEQWFATLHQNSDEPGRPLLSLTDELAGHLSDAAIRSGFVSVAEWLVTTGRWSD